MEKPKLSVEDSFNLLVQLARSQKLTWNEHQKVTLAIETVLEALNQDTVVNEVREIPPDSPEK